MRLGRGWRRAPRVGSVEVAIIGLVGVIIGTLLGALAAARNQVRAEVREKRRDLYLKWLLFIDRMPMEGKKAIVEKRQSQYMNSMHERLNDITTEIDMYASKEVTAAWNKVRERLMDERLEAAILDAVSNRRDETQGRLDLAWQLVYREFIADARDELFKAMRRDIGTWKRSYGR
jgi:hypothetical protein